MTYLYTGIALFVVAHLIPSFPAIRQNLTDRLSTKGYMAIFNVVSLASLVLIVIGLKQAPFLPLYEPPTIGRYLNMALMFPALYLFLSNSRGPAPSSAQAWTAHPMSWGVVIWSFGHLLANGDLAHVVLFLTFLLVSAVSIVSGNRRGAQPSRTQRPALAREAVFVVIILVVYLALFATHRFFTGMPLVAV